VTDDADSSDDDDTAAAVADTDSQAGSQAIDMSGTPETDNNCEVCLIESCKSQLSDCDGAELANRVRDEGCG